MRLGQRAFPATVAYPLRRLTIYVPFGLYWLWNLNYCFLWKSTNHVCCIDWTQVKIKLGSTSAPREPEVIVTSEGSVKDEGATVARETVVHADHCADVMDSTADAAEAAPVHGSSSSDVKDEIGVHMEGRVKNDAGDHTSDVNIGAQVPVQQDTRTSGWRGGGLSGASTPGHSSSDGQCVASRSRIKRPLDEHV
jgi:hypothetical protein